MGEAEFINMGKEEGDIIIGNKGIKPAWTCEEEAVLDRNKWKQRDRKKKRNTWMGDAGEAVLEKNGDDSTDATMDDGGKKIKNKKKKREKNKGIYQASKSAEVDVGCAKELKLNECLKMLVEEKFSELNSQNEVKIHKAARSHKHDGGRQGEEERDRDEIGMDCEVKVEKVQREKRKRERKKKKCNGGVRCHDTCTDSRLEDGTVANCVVEIEDESKRKFGTVHEDHYVDSSRKIEKKKKKKKIGTGNYDRDFSVKELENDEVSGQSTEPGGNIKNKKRDELCDTEAHDANKRTKKRMAKSVEDGSNDFSPNRCSKKVRFSAEDEVFLLPDDSNTEHGKNDEGNMVRGKRFTKEEDGIVRDAVWNYIKEHDLGDKGLDMVLNSSKHREVKGCWKEIGAAIPYRPYASVYFRAHLLFRNSFRKWTQEEYDMLLKHHERHGNDWRALADELGRHECRVMDTWRRIKFRNLKKGHWSQEEYQKLFNLVNTDLQLKLTEEKKSRHGMLRDNICWTAISENLASRCHSSCCRKWYKQLTSPMVEQGLWDDADDYRLLGALYSLDASCKEDVDWDNLLNTRTGDLCLQRWNQMVLHIGHHGNRSFSEQVEVLAQRYCPQLISAREAWDNKPMVP